MSYISDRIITKYKTDTINEFAKDSLINFVSRKKELADKYELATIYLSYGQYDNMTTLLNNIERNFEMSDEMLNDFNNYKTVLNISKIVQQEVLFEGGLSDLQRDSLLDIFYNDRPQVSAMALALLKRNNPEFKYSEIIYNIGEEAPMANPNNSGNIIQENSNESDEFMIYPNPSIDYVTLRYNANYNNLIYTITDISGAVILQKELETIENSEYNEVLIDLRQLAPGTYYMSVKTNNTSLFNSKLVITK